MRIAFDLLHAVRRKPISPAYAATVLILVLVVAWAVYLAVAEGPGNLVTEAAGTIVSVLVLERILEWRSRAAQARAGEFQREVIRGLLEVTWRELFETLSRLVGVSDLGHPLWSPTWDRLLMRYTPDEWEEIEAAVSSRPPEDEGGTVWLQNRLDAFRGELDPVVGKMIGLPSSELECHRLVLISRCAKTAFVKVPGEKRRLLADALALLISEVAGYLHAYEDAGLERFWSAEGWEVERPPEGMAEAARAAVMAASRRRHRPASEADREEISRAHDQAP